MPFSRLFMLVFGLITILGALLTSGWLGEGGMQTAVGLTLLMTGVIGMVNVIFFTRLKRSLDRRAAEHERKTSAHERQTDADDPA